MSGGRRVAVTGLAMLTGAGLDRESSWRGILAGKSPARRFTRFDPAGLPVTSGVELPDGAEELAASLIRPRSRAQMTWGTMLAVIAAEQALEDAGVGAALDPARAGVVLGATGTGHLSPAGAPDEHRILRSMQNAPAAWVSLRHKLTGPSCVVATACSSGTYALAAAAGLILSGQCDLVISGSADSSLNHGDVAGFAALLALAEDDVEPSRMARPFHRARGGFVMGEGAGVLVLESLESASRRGARVQAEMSLPGLSSEGYNILSPQPDGAGMAETMRRALANAGLAPKDIDYLNAHGTGTALNDRCETEAVRAVFGHRAASLPVSSTKAVTGHCLAGAAGIEAVVCCLALRDGVIPPTGNLDDPDPELGLDFVPLTARPARLRHVLSNAFAFGGQNGAVVFSLPGAFDAEEREG